MIAALVSGFPAKAGFRFQLFQYAFLTPETLKPVLNVMSRVTLFY